MATIIETVSGRKAVLPADLDADRVVGLDPAGRIVVNDFDAFNAEPTVICGYFTAPSLFGLTLCCNAYDKGVEDGIVCRGCYGYDEVGDYLPRAADGTFPDLDPRVGLDPCTGVLA